MGILSTLGDKLRGRAPCPVCARPLDLLLAPANLLCTSCDTYLERADGALHPIPEERIEERHVFGAPTHWPDIRNVTFPTIKFSVDDYLSDLVMTKRSGVKVLEAHWPSGCAICCKPPTRVETVARVIVFYGPGLIKIRDQEATVVANNVPHCNEHTGGMVLDRIDMPGLNVSPAFGLLFRSLAYRNLFRQLNAWPWPELE